jgi:hypothetical protein
MNNSNLPIRGLCKLPCLEIVTIRSNSAKLHKDSTHITSTIDETTPYFKHPTNDSIGSCFANQDISSLCHQILREQNILMQKIDHQQKIIQKICKRKLPAYHSLEPDPETQENKEITFKPQLWPNSTRNKKVFKFPREVFPRKNKSRVS